MGEREFCTFAVSVVKPPPSPSRRDVVCKRTESQRIKTHRILIMKYFTLPLLLPILFSCAPKSPLTDDVKIIEFEYTSSTPLYQCEWIEAISFTPLQNSSLIGAESELRILGDNLFVKHGPYTSTRIDRFNIRGEYRNRIGRDGRGPGEISGLMSDWFLYSDTLLGINLYGHPSILLYDYDGNFNREVDHPSTAFMVHSDGIHFWALMPHVSDSTSLICLSDTGEALKSMLRSEKTYSVAADLWRPFFKTNGKLYIGMPYHNTIFLAQKDTIIPAFIIEAGKYEIPPEYYDDPFVAFRPLRQKGYAFVYNFLESNDYFVIQVVIRQDEFEGMIWGINNKRTDKWFWSDLERWSSKQETFEYKTADITEDNRLMILIHQDELKELLPFMKNPLNPQVVMPLNENDNPVLVEIRLI